LVLLCVVSVTACTGDKRVPAADPLDPTATNVPETLVEPEATLPPADELPGAVADELIESVTGTIGLTFPEPVNVCLHDRLISTLGAPALADVGLGGELSDEPVAVQQDIFSAFDECITTDAYVQAGFTVLTGAGATERWGSLTPSPTRAWPCWPLAFRTNAAWTSMRWCPTR
jgi:hypothetical protein